MTPSEQFAKSWYERDPEGRDEKTLAFLLGTDLDRLVQHSIHAERMRVRRRMERLLNE